MLGIAHNLFEELVWKVKSPKDEERKSDRKAKDEVCLCPTF